MALRLASAMSAAAKTSRWRQLECRTFGWSGGILGAVMMPTRLMEISALYFCILMTLYIAIFSCAPISSFMADLKFSTVQHFMLQRRGYSSRV